MVAREEFYDRFTALLQELSPGRDFKDLQPDSHLWMGGYVDSVAMLDIITFVEELIGDDLDLDGEFLRNFSSMEGIYEAYIAQRAEMR
jgi:hypothetical protein